MVDEIHREFYFTTSDTARKIHKEKILSIQPKYALYNQADLLLELGYKKSDKDGIQFDL